MKNDNTSLLAKVVLNICYLAFSGSIRIPFFHLILIFTALKVFLIYKETVRKFPVTEHYFLMLFATYNFIKQVLLWEELGDSEVCQVRQKDITFWEKN